MNNLSLVLIILTSAFILYGCKSQTQEIKMQISFEPAFHNSSSSVFVAYTNDPDSMWSKSNWVLEVKKKMIEVSMDFDTVLLFSSKENTPNVSVEGMSYSQEFDKYMVCGYWKYPNGEIKYCYGGVKQDGNFRYCE